MFTLPNLISFARIPLALCFFQANPMIRSIGIILALISDGLDGYLARRLKLGSRFGAILDPFTDKFFVLTAGCVLIFEGRLSITEVCILISRDFAILLFMSYLFVKHELWNYRVHAIWSGKITTVLQFFVLLALVWGVLIPNYIFGVFLLLGILALLELFYTFEQPNAI